ncbi:MAG: GH1 family beta-glucosidase, partial [Acidimicrobiia bacterium]
YQIEGAVTAGGRLPSIWDTFSHTGGKVRDGDTGDVACDHYHRWRHDIRLMKELGVAGYRFSIAWPRIFPEGRGRSNPEGLAFYDRLVDGLLEAGITPYATLYHWDLPQMLYDQGGWLNRDTAAAMADYAAAVAGRLGDRVKDWMTINEPWVASHLGHGTGEHAPGHTDWAEVWPVAHHLLVAHGLSTQAVRATVPSARVGIVLNLEPQYPASQHPLDIAATRLADGTWNRWFLDPISGRGYPEDATAAVEWDQAQVRDGDLDLIATATDFLGVNFYSRKIIRSEELAEADRPGRPPQPEETTEMGWEVYPEGLYDMLTRVQTDYEFPLIYVTENGAAFADELVDGEVHDPARISYLERHLAQVHRAIDAGVPVAGYFAWSLMDNFEWGHGYSKRFGLTYVDYISQDRIVKASGRWYADVIQRGGLRT